MTTPAHAEPTVNVYHGNCALILPQLDIQADLLLTSPPYDKVRNYGGHTFHFPTVAQACYDAIAPGGVLVWIVADGIRDHARTGTSMRQALHFMQLGLRLHDHMVYEKMGLFNRTHVRYCPAWQHMFVLSKGPLKTVNLLQDRPNATAARRVRHYYGGFGRKPNGVRSRPRPDKAAVATPDSGIRTNIWTYPVGGHSNQSGSTAPAPIHPAAFPLALARDHIASWTKPGDMVIDPMAGSGTTLRAAKDLNRLAIGIEIHEPYLQEIRDKLAQQVLRLSTGDTDHQ